MAIIILIAAWIARDNRCHNAGVEQVDSAGKESFPCTATIVQDVFHTWRMVVI